MLLAGVPVHVVAARLGHDDPAVTLRVYPQVLREHAVGVADISAHAVKPSRLLLANPLASRSRRNSQGCILAGHTGGQGRVEPPAFRFSGVVDGQLRRDVREYTAVYGCVRALTTEVVAVTVAVGDTSGPPASQAGSRFKAGRCSASLALPYSACKERPAPVARGDVQMRGTWSRSGAQLHLSKKVSRSRLCFDGPGPDRARRWGRFPDEPEIRDHPSDYRSGYLARVAHYLRCQPHLWGSALLTYPL
jgi:hypothetical protein